MKIGIYSPYLDTVSGGERYMLTMALCLAKNNDVAIFWDNNTESHIKLLTKKRFDLDLSSIPFVNNIFSSKVSLLERYKASGSYDMIIVLSDGSIPIVASKLMLHFQFPVPWVYGKSFMNRIKMARVSRVICNSSFTKSYIDRTFGIYSEVIYPPFLQPLQKSKKKENIVLSVGRFGRTLEGANFKKQDAMIETFKKMIDNGVKNWEFFLVIAIRQEDNNRLESLKRSAKGYPIHFLVNVSHKTLWEYYEKAKIYWHAAGYGEDIERHPGYAEHFGIATVEAMSVGAVPVVIDAGGQPEIVSDAANGFLWRTQDEWIQKTILLMDDKQLFEKLSSQAVLSVGRFSEERFCREYNGLVNRFGL